MGKVGDRKQHDDDVRYMTVTSRIDLKMYLELGVSTGSDVVSTPVRCSGAVLGAGSVPRVRHNAQHTTIAQEVFSTKYVVLSSST
jgi:hypothetical protein